METSKWFQHVPTSATCSSWLASAAKDSSRRTDSSQQAVSRASPSVSIDSMVPMCCPLRLRCWQSVGMWWARRLGLRRRIKNTEKTIQNWWMLMFSHVFIKKSSPRRRPTAGAFLFQRQNGARLPEFLHLLHGICGDTCNTSTRMIQE